jgi:ABC-type glycerol-3-phosphate transport system substrate-binding protein
MRNKTKLLCVALLVTLLVSMLASCGGNDQPSVTPAESTSPSETTPSETPSEVTPGDDVGVKFPLVDEPATLTVWRPWFNTLVTDANDLVCNQLIEQKTNVHIEWTLVSVFSIWQGTSQSVFKAADKLGGIFIANGIADTV